jgi:hypothetical protein
MSNLLLTSHPVRGHKMLLMISLILITMFMQGDLKAQDVRIRNATDQTHPWASQTNPALLAFQNRQISLGLKAFHYGFLPDNSLGLKETHLNASFPFLLPIELGFGGDIRYYTAGIYSELTTSLILSKQIFDNFSLGLNMGVLSTGFSRESFKLLQVNDPLLQKDLRKNQLTYGLGAFWQSGNWAIGFGIDPLNEPDMGFQSEAKLPTKISGSMSYRFQRVVPSLTFHDDGNRLHYGLSVAIKSEKIGLIRLGYQSEMPFNMEIQVNLSHNSSLQYGIDLPGENLSVVSLGSHELVFKQVLGQAPEIGQPELIISTPKLKILEETIIRSMPANFSLRAIEEMDEMIYEFTDSKVNLSNSIVVKAGALNMDETEKIRMERYTRIGEAIRLALKENPDFQVIIRTDSWSMRDARALQQFLSEQNYASSKALRLAKLNSSRKADLSEFKPGQSTTSSMRTKLSVAKLEIMLNVPGQIRKVKNWQLSILDENGIAVKNIPGEKKLPEIIEWNWKNNTGQIVREGRYTCQLGLTTENGQTKTSTSQPIQVDHIKRTIKLEFKSEPKMLISQANSTKN